MAVWIRDSFEFYKNLADTVTGSGFGMWDVQNLPSGAFSDFTPFGYGKSLSDAFASGTNPILKKGSFSNQNVVLAACRFIQTSVLGGATDDYAIQFYDSTTVQCSIIFRLNGTIVVKTGSFAGSVAATFSGAFLANQWNHFQIRVTFGGGTSGLVEIRQNGAASNTFTSSGIATISSANAYANGVAIGQNNNANGQYLDDFASWDQTGTSPWNNWVGDIRCVVLMPNADTAQADFSQNNSGSTTFGHTTNSSTNARLANIIYLQQATPTCGGTISTITVELSSGFTGNMNVAIYDSNGNGGGTPSSQTLAGSLLGSCTTVVNPSTGTNVFTLTSTVTVLNGHTYFIAIWTDTAFTEKSDTVTINSSSVALTFTGVFPASVTSGGIGPSNSLVKAASAYATITPTNSGQVNDRLEDGTTTYLSDSTAADYDLYTIQPMPFTPTGILGVDFVGMVSKSDAGARTGALRMVSGVTTLDEATITPNTSLTYYKYQIDLDPNTSGPWALANINAVKIGPLTVS